MFRTQSEKKEIEAELGEMAVVMLLGAIRRKEPQITSFGGLGHCSDMLMWFHAHVVSSLKNSRESPFYT